MANAKEMNVAVRLHADASQYTAEFTRAGKVAQDFSARVSGSVGGASSSIDSVAASLSSVSAQAPKLGAIPAALDKTTAAAQRTAIATSESVKSTATSLNDIGNQAPKLGAVPDLLNKSTLSAKQTAAALRGVPAQFTDIVTSIQGGQAPMTVFLQQGGQLKDMFGGAGNAARALGGYVLGLVNPFTVAAAGAVAVGYAMYKGAEQQRAWQSALIVSGNAAGATAGQIEQVYAAVSKSTGQYGASEDAIISLVRGRQVAIEQLGATAASVVKFSRAAGVEASALVDDFNLIGREPVQAVIKLHEKYGILTASTYQQAHALAEQGKQQEAVVLVQTRATEAMDAIAAKAKENKGYIQAFWDAVKGGMGRAVQGVADWGKDVTPEAQLAQLQQALADRQARGALNDSAGATASYAKGIANLQAEISKLQELVAANQAAAKVQADSAEVNKRATSGLTKLNSAYDSHMSKQDRLIKQLRELKQARDDALKAPDVDAKAVNDRYAATVEDVKRQLAPSFNMASLMHSLYLQESGNRQWRDDGSVVKNAKSGATGIAQIVPKYGADYARMAGVEWSEESLKTDPEYGKRLAEAGIKTYLKMFGNDIEKALAAYNWGPGNVRNAVGELGDGWKARLPAETSGYLTGILGRMPKDGAGDYSDTLGAAPSSAYEKALTDARNQLAKATAEADAAQRGLTKSQTEFEAIQQSPVWATYNASQQATLALSYQQMEVQDKIKASAVEGDKIKSMADAQEAANAVFGQSKVAIEEWKSAQLGANAAVAQALGQSPQFVAQLQKTADEQQRYVAALKDADMKQTLAGLEEWRRSASEQAKLYADEALMAGLTAKERAMVVAARQVELKLLKQIAEIEKKGWNNPEDKQKAIGLANEAATIEKNAALAKVIQDDWSKTSDQINQSLTDALMRGFESGKDFGANLRDTLVNMFRTMILRPTISAVMAPISGVINGVVNAGLNAVGLGSGGAGGVLSAASSLSSIGNTLSGIGSTVSTTMTGLSTGATSLGSILTATGAQVATAATYGTAIGSAQTAMLAAQTAGMGTGAAGAGTAALGAIPVYGWIALAAVAAFAAFSGKGDSRFGSQGSYTPGKGTESNGGPNGANDDFGGVSAGNKSTAETIDKILGKVGSKDRLSYFAGGFESSENDKGFSYAGGILSNGKVFGQGTDGQGYMNARGSMNAEEAQARYINELKQATLQALQSATDIPKAISSKLDGVDVEALDQKALDVLVGVIDKIIVETDTFASAVKDLPIDNLKNMSFDATAALIETAGGLQKLTEGTAFVYQTLYSESERAAVVTGQLAKGFADIGLAVPESDAALRQLIVSQDLSTESGRNMVVALGALAPAFDSVANAARASAQQMMGIMANYASEGEQRAFAIEQIRKGLVDGGINVSAGQIGSASRDQAWQLYKDQLAAGNLQQADAIKNQLDAFAKITQASGSMMGSSGSSGSGSSGSAGAQIRNEWQSICDSLVDEIKRVRGELAGTGKDGLAYAQAQYAIANAQARAGDADAAKALPQLNRTLLDLAEGNASSSLELRRMQAQQAASLQATHAILAVKYGVKVPAFASGGDHLGGLRLVGERGPELESTGASRIWNAEQTRALLGGGSGGDSAETAALLRDMCGLMQRLVEVTDLGTGYTKDIEGLLARVTEKGSAMRSKAVTA